jgi:hypothetical protein
MQLDLLKRRDFVGRRGKKDGAMGAETDADVRVAWSPRGNPAQVWLLK